MKIMFFFFKPRKEASITLKITIISPPNPKKGEAKVVSQLLELGLERFHLRKPDCNISQIATFLDEIPKEFLSRIIIHRMPELLKDYPLGGYHHSEREDFREIKGIRSRSLHKLNHLQNCDNELDYVFFGPVYQSISKKGYCPKVSLNEIRKTILKMKNQPNAPLVYALGGIRRNKISYLRETGFDGVALLGSIWGKPDPVDSYLSFRDAIENQYPLESSRH